MSNIMNYISITIEEARFFTMGVMPPMKLCLQEKNQVNRRIPIMEKWTLRCRLNWDQQFVYNQRD